MTDKLQLPFECFRITKDSPGFNKVYNTVSLTHFIGAFLCTEGKIEVNIDERLYKITKGDMYFFSPSLFVRTLYVSNDFQGIAIRVDYDFITPVINNVLDIQSQLHLREEPCLSLTLHQYEEVYILFSSLQESIENKNNEDITGPRLHVMRELIKSFGKTIAYVLVDIYMTRNPIEPQKQDHTDAIIQKFIINVYRDFRNHREVSYYADNLCITASYLSCIVKAKTGKPALQWIIDLVISDAKQMLQYSDLSIKEIATRLNFSTQSFFGKYFKQYVNMSPKNFRKKNKELTD